MEHKSPGRIVVIDDRGTICESLGGVLTDDGYKVLTLTAESEAHLFPALEPGIVAVITDLMMPGCLSGVEVAMFLREKGFRGKVILITACNDPELPLVAKTAEIDAILAKPFAIRELEQALN